MVKFYKYYKKDSARHVRKQEKHYQKLLDSTYRSDAKQDRIKRRLSKKGVVLPTNKHHGDTLDTQLQQWYAVMKDSCSTDSTKKVAKNKVKELAVQKAKQHPGFQHQMDKYNINGDTINWETVTQQVPGIDTLSDVFDSSPEQLFKIAEDQSIKQFQDISGAGALPGEFAEADKLKSLPDQYKKEYEQYTNKEKLKTEGKDKAVQEAMDYFAEHPEKLKFAQMKMSKLLGKYKDIPNSGDLSTAVKRTSMQGKTFFEHLVFGGNFNVVSTDPVAVDFSPLLGYKINTNFYMGIGLNYRHTFGDSIKSSWYISPRNTAYKVFANYDIIKGFFTYGEWERSGVGAKSNDKSINQWKNNYFIGVGKKFLIHPKVYMTSTLLYNLNNEQHNPVHPKRFQVRIGFQTSELATRKKKIYYDPNR